MNREAHNRTTGEKKKKKKQPYKNYGHFISLSHFTS